MPEGNSYRLHCSLAVKNLPDLIVMDWTLPGFNTLDAVVPVAIQAAGRTSISTMDDFHDGRVLVTRK